jgi:uncharacterized protein with HEPN domain
MFKRTDSLYITDIRESAEAIIQFTEGISFETFSNDRMRYSAVIREFEIIGEAVGKLSDTVKDNYSQVNWQDIKDFRNILIHEYFGIDLGLVWNVVCEDLPKLYETIKAMELRANFMEP